MRLLVLRHGASTWNSEHRWQGWGDPPLSKEGMAQAAAAAVALSEITAIAKVVSSDLARARMTAEVIAGALQAPVFLEPLLRERNIGLWTGRASAEIETQWPGQIETYRTNPLMAFPEGEETEGFVERARSTLVRLAQEPPKEAVAVVVTHNGLIRCVNAMLGEVDQAVRNLSGCWLGVADDARLRVRGWVELLPTSAPGATADHAVQMRSNAS